ncbi:uncharacterized protein [Periplaneta americana]|uniref:uncharacterized protein n=1 Tax=Periplaneta americana TaxID=6978 RepID=UPI0037E874A9
MYYSHKKSPVKSYKNMCTAIGFDGNNNNEKLIRSNHTSFGSEYGECQDARHDKRYRKKQLHSKTPTKANKVRTGSASSNNSSPSLSNSSEFSAQNRETLDENADFLHSDTIEYINRGVKSLNKIQWPTLTKTKKKDAKCQSPPRLVDIELQTEQCDHEIKYPLWNTREIVLFVEDDVPVYQHNKVSRGAQTESDMLIRREIRHLQHSTGEAHNTVPVTSNHKTYADAVQQKTDFRALNTIPIPELKTFFKLRDMRMIEIPELLQQFQNYSVNTTNSQKSFFETNSSLTTDSIGINLRKIKEKNESVFTYEELLQTLMKVKDTTELKCDEQDMFGCSRMSNENECTYHENGDGDSILKIQDISNAENEGSFTDDYISSASFVSSNFSYYADNIQNCFRDSFYIPDQIKFREMAESIATEGLDPEIAFIVVNDLWRRNKVRMPYTRRFTKATDFCSHYEDKQKSESCQQVDNNVTNWLQLEQQRVYQYLSNYTVERHFNPVIYESERRVNGRYLLQMQVSEIHQHCLSQVGDHHGYHNYSNSWKYPSCPQENNGVMYSLRHYCC